MDDSRSLEHTPAPTSLGRVTRSGIIARGRSDAARAQSNPDYRRAMDLYGKGDTENAVAAFRVAAHTGHAESQYMLSTLLDAGEGAEHDEEEAALWEKKAAEQGHAYAQANLSFRFYSDNAFEQAFQWCQRAAFSQLAWAQFHVGLMYRKGEGVAQSDTQAAHWYRLAAEQDFAEAQVKLAELYSVGLGVPRSDAQTATWYRRAAEQSHAEAQFQLGHLYAVGLGVEPDYVQSRYWTKQAALQGHEAAMREQKRRDYRDA